MKLGWSDEGSPGLRATHADRGELRRILDLAGDEGRLDTVEHDRRTEAVRAAKTRADLAAVAADLPARKGMREWLDGARIRSADRELAAEVLAGATASGRLTAAEYEDRVVRLTEAATYERLKRVLSGLPGWPGADEARLRPTTADREAALAVLTRAVADGRVLLGEHGALAAEIASVTDVAELAKTAGLIARRASDADRAAATALLGEALADGRLDHGEHAARTERAESARTTEDLTALTADLSGKARRLSNADRTATAAVLKRALDDGSLDLDEYDARLTAAYAATTVADTRSLLADLAAPPRYPTRGPLDLAFDHWVGNSALLTAPRDLIDRLHPKPLWKLGLLGILAGWGWAIAAMGPIWLGLTVGAGWIPVAALLAVNNRIARIGSGDTLAREAEIVAGIGRALAPRADLRSCAAELEGDTLTVRFDPQGKARGIPTALFDEVVRLAWRSRLYPLRTVVVSNADDHERDGLRLMILDHHAKELRHRHGKRPYGPLPADTG